MRSSIAKYKESLSRIALDVQGAAEDLETDGSDAFVPSNRRSSQRFTQSTSTAPDGGSDEIDQYKYEIQKLRASESEIKQLSINYAALLKENEEQLLRLRKENSSLKKNLEVKNTAGCPTRDENPRAFANSSTSQKGNGDHSPIRQYKNVMQSNYRTTGSNSPKGVFAKHDASTNGSQSNGVQRNAEMKHTNSQGTEKELAGLLEENRSLAAVQAKHEPVIKQLEAQLEKERGNVAHLKLKLQEEHNLSESVQRELHDMKIEKDRTFTEMDDLRNQLKENMLELQRLQLELNRRNLEKADGSLESLKCLVTSLEKENAQIKMDNGKFEAALKVSTRQSFDRTDIDDNENVNRQLDKFNELEKTLKDACRERDKALQELVRLKQHLLDKEMEESDKMDEDSKLIEELQTRSAHQRNQLLHLEKALKQAVSKQEELRKMNRDEIQRADEIINDLKQKLSRSMATIESKDVELLNLQTALGQFYAESEQKDRLGRDLALARDESAKLTESLRVANQLLEASTKEKEDILLKLSQTENMLSESRNAIFKLEQDNIKVRSALEKSITSLNRMSLDSDNFVDRRIVIKLLVTYFQRNHSKEVLDVMVRILGFSDEDKQRIGAAQQIAGKGVVRGVLGFPGRFVGGILGGSSSGVSSPLPGDNQSFADLWVDFLLKETEEKGRQENAETKMPEQSVGTGATTSSISDVHLPTQHNRSHLTSNRNTPYEHAGSEFTSVPLTSSMPQAPERNSGFSRFLQR